MSPRFFGKANSLRAAQPHDIDNLAPIRLIDSQIRIGPTWEIDDGISAKIRCPGGGDPLGRSDYLGGEYAKAILYRRIDRQSITIEVELRQSAAAECDLFGHDTFFGGSSDLHRRSGTLYIPSKRGSIPV